jgi:glycosyltransferase involved in cell wall biosynthesis
VSRITLSVIVPILNPQRYLSNLRTLLIELDEEGIEVLFIHDTYADENSDLLSDLRELTTKLRIRVISGHFGSAGSARNAGLAESTGEWICFCDADDHLYLQQILMDLKGMQNIALLVGQFERMNQENKIEVATPVMKLSELTCDPGFWRIVYKKSAIGEIKFQDFRMGEDIIFLADVLRKNPKIDFSARIYYRYSVGNPGQSTTSSANFGDLTKAIAFLKMRNPDWHKDPIDFGFVARLSLSNLSHYSKSSFVRSMIQIKTLIVLNPSETRNFFGRLIKSRAYKGRFSNFV